MPNWETKSKMLEGRGEPSADLGLIGDRYTDLNTGELYSKKKTGWSNLTQIVIHPTMSQALAWGQAAARKKQSRARWIYENLDAAAEKDL